MGNFIENRPVPCIYCRYSPVQGRVSTFEDRRGIVTECRYICPKCGNLIRCDEAVQPKVKKEEKKKEEKKKDPNENKK